jgi:hypothetical protein
MAAGSIVVDLLMKTGSFETDTARAEKRLRAFQKQAEAVGRAIGIGLVAAATGAAAAFQLLVSAAGDFKDLEEQTGASAESLASLAISASVAGTSVADMAGQMNKLTKNLSGVDDESKAAGAALSALGIPIEEFKKLDPVGQIDALSKAFGGFADGSQKTAVALALFGKSGAQMLSVFKELQSSGGRQTILTQQQIELADDFTDSQKRLTAEITAYAQAGATDLLPVLNDLTKVAKEVAAEFFGIDEAGKKLAGSSAVKDFAEGAVAALAFVIDAGQGVTRIFESIGLYLGATGAAMTALWKGEFAQAARIAEEARGDIEKILSADLFSQRLARLRQAAGRDASGDFDDSAARVPRLAFDGAKDADKKKAAAVSEAQRYLEGLQKQIEKTKELSAYEQALADIQNKRLKGITPALERQILAEAKLLDATKQAKEARDAQVATTTKLQKARLDDLDAIVKGNVELEKEIALLGLDEAGKQAVELQTTRVARAEKELTLAKQEAAGVAETQLQVLQQEIDLLKEREGLLVERNDKSADVAATDAAKKAGDAYRDTLGDSIEEGILDGFRRGGSFTDVFLNELKAQFAKTILRPLIQPAVDTTNKAIADLFGQAAGAFSGLFSGSSYSYQGTTLPNSLRGGADTGTNMLERDMITLVHKGEAIVPKAYNPAAGGKAGGNVYITNNTPSRVSAQQDENGDFQVLVEQAARIAHQRVDSSIARGGSTAKAIAGTYGVSRSAGAPKRA